MTAITAAARRQVDTFPGFAPFRVSRKQVEARDICSFYLEPERADDWRPFKAGQHLALKLDCPGRPLATYTISSGPDQRGIYRITVKREAKGKGGSVYLHDRVEEGARLFVSSPRGSFVLDDSKDPVLLLTGGIGVTPAVSMLRCLARQSDRSVLHVHSVVDGTQHALVDELREYAESSGASLHVGYTYPSSADRTEGRYDIEGMLNRGKLRTILPQDRWRVYMCGPHGFMSAMREALTSLGIPDERIHQELFAAAGPECVSSQKQVGEVPNQSDVALCEVRFRNGGDPVQWRPQASNLLELLEDAGYAPDFSCRAGICGTCALKVLSGEVVYDEEPLEDPGDGRVLLCCARPKTDILLDL